jgi:sugar phosphate isomerase/epimerase
MRLSLSTAFSNKGSLEDKLSVLSQAGFTHIGIDEKLTSHLLHHEEKGINKLIKLLVKFDLSVDWIHAPMEGMRLYSLDKRTWLKSLSSLSHVIKLAYKTKARSIVLHTFDDISGIPESIRKSVIQLHNGLFSLLEMGYKWNVVIALENLIKPYMNTVTLALFDKLPDLGLCFDTGHAEISSTWKDFFSPDLSQRIVALHLNDNNGRADDHLIPGQGIINFYKCISRLVQGGYSGIWGIECKQGFGNYNGDLLTIAKRAFSYFMSIITEQGVRAQLLSR